MEDDYAKMRANVVFLLLQHLFWQAGVPPCEGRIRRRSESSWGAAVQGDVLQGEEAIVR